jgi:hypothetical protein
MDPAAVQRRNGGRKPVDYSYFLRGIAFCGRCGAALYTRRQAEGRVYVCANVRQCTGLCDASGIPAGLFEAHVLDHLEAFVGSVEKWIGEQVNARSAEHEQRVAAVERERKSLADLDRQREAHMAEYRRMVGEGDALARYALETIEGIDRDREAQARRIAEAESVVSEWTAPPDVDAALDFYTGLLDLVQGQVRQADGTAELNQALSTVLAGLWAEVEPDRDRLLVEFELRVPTKDRLFGGVPVLPMFRHRPTLPPRHLGDLDVEPKPGLIPSCGSSRSARRSRRRRSPRPSTTAPAAPAA